MNDKPTRKPVTPVTVLIWALPVLGGLAVMALAFARGWEPWFGYGAVIAGVLGAVMLASEHFGVSG
ncbi:hypothetical protein F1654_00200 [Alkalicaulis satelles]|uniref:Uncharacterized protein n=1 Tax=Alkalicaulis satelles TaxID=2609175 RepID=A0A5M6ZQD8_9PROT|nr:hypothetical protein [Alkalicaulis satelles]KAA5804471.1 hypothetical protein F1654_00200 [Alkalicaulis satelles]